MALNKLPEDITKYIADLERRISTMEHWNNLVIVDKLEGTLREISGQTSAILQLTTGITGMSVFFPFYFDPGEGYLLPWTEFLDGAWSRLIWAQDNKIVFKTEMRTGTYPISLDFKCMVFLAKMTVAP